MYIIKINKLITKYEISNIILLRGAYYELGLDCEILIPVVASKLNGV